MDLRFDQSTYNEVSVRPISKAINPPTYWIIKLFDTTSYDDDNDDAELVDSWVFNVRDYDGRKWFDVPISLRAGKEYRVEASATNSRNNAVRRHWSQLQFCDLKAGK